jgi:hypothetical protein
MIKTMAVPRRRPRQELFGLCTLSLHIVYYKLLRYLPTLSTIDSPYFRKMSGRIHDVIQGRFS